MCSIYIFTYFHSLCLWTIFFFSLHYCISVVVCLIIFDNSTLLKLVRFFCCCWFFSFNLVYTFRLIFGSDFISISENFSVCPIFPKDKEEEKNNERMNIAFFNKCQHNFWSCFERARVPLFPTNFISIFCPNFFVATKSSIEYFECPKNVSNISNQKLSPSQTNENTWHNSKRFLID